MDKLKYSELQIQEMLYGDVLSIVKESRRRLEEMQVALEKDQKNKRLQKEYDKEYDAFIKLFSTLTNPISSKEH